jgi:hypothetical protein
LICNRHEFGVILRKFPSTGSFVVDDVVVLDNDFFHNVSVTIKAYDDVNKNYILSFNNMKYYDFFVRIFALDEVNGFDMALLNPDEVVTTRAYADELHRLLN